MKALDLSSFGPSTNSNTTQQQQQQQQQQELHAPVARQSSASPPPLFMSSSSGNTPTGTPTAGSTLTCAGGPSPAAAAAAQAAATAGASNTGAGSAGVSRGAERSQTEAAEAARQSGGSAGPSAAAEAGACASPSAATAAAAAATNIGTSAPGAGAGAGGSAHAGSSAHASNSALMPPPPPRTRTPPPQPGKGVKEAAAPASASGVEVKPEPGTSAEADAEGAAGVRLDTGPGTGADRGPTATTAAPTAALAVPPWLSGPLSHIYNLRNAVTVAKHAMLIQQMREMVQAILRIDIPDLADIATGVAMRIHVHMSRQQVVPQSLDVVELHTIKAVLKVLEIMFFFDHEGDLCTAGSAAVLVLRHAVFGAAAGVSEPETLDALAFGSMSKVRAFHTSCLWLLLASLRPSNCLRLWQLGQVLELQQLHDQALLYCLSNLRRILDGPGREEFVQLAVREVQVLLSNTNVQLSSELEVWEALSLWVNYSLPDRKGDVAKLLGSCLRLQDMDVLQLQQLRQTPLVTGSPAAASLVSAAYTRRMVSSVHMSRTDINSGTAPSGVSDGGASRGGGLGSDGSPMGMNVQMGVAGGVSSLTVSPDGAAALGGPSGLLTTSPDEEQLLKKPRLGQEGIAAAVAGHDVVARVDGGHRPG